MIRGIKRLIDVLFVVVIVLLIGYFVLRNIGMIEIYEVETGSMEDGIHPGDYVLIVRKDSYTIGDIVTYVKDDYYVTHRIIKEDASGVVTKGDANNTEDDEISRDAIVGKVIFIGGLLNILINYKYALVSFLLGLYLFSCYFYKSVDSNTCVKDEEDEIIDDVVDRRIELLFRKRLKKRIRVEYRKK